MSDIIDDSIASKSRTRTLKVAHRLSRKFQEQLEDLELLPKTKHFFRTLKSNLIANLKEIHNGFVNGKRQDRS